MELLAALVISGFVVAMAGRIFLSGHAQFVKRSSESERLEELYRLKAQVHGALTGEIARCEGGKLWLRDAKGEIDFEAALKAKSKAIEGARFRCVVPEAGSGGLTEWTGGGQPSLVEYSVRLRTRGAADTLAGSAIR